MVTKLHPSGDAKIAERVAGEAGAVHRVIHVDELSHAGIMDNPENRCYLCKRYLYTKLLKSAKALGIQTVLEGTNADDLNAYRPGIRAVKELGILSPLVQAGRFPYGTRLSWEKMKMAEEGEKFLRTLGFYNVRVRIHGDTARIEVDEKDLPGLVKNRAAAVKRLKEIGFTYITVDLEGFRSGSMDTHLKQGKEK